MKSHEQAMEMEPFECMDPSLGEYRGLYHLGRLSEAERARFEEHTAECGACAYEVYQLAPYMKTLRRMLAEEPERLRQALGAAASEAVAKRPEQKPTGWERWLGFLTHTPWVCAAVTALVLVVFVSLLFRSLNNPYVELARLERAEPLTPVLRGGAAATTLAPAASGDDAAFAEALRSYQAGHDQEAEKLLQRVTEKDPKNAEAWLLLGSCYVMESERAKGIAALDECARRAQRSPNPEKARWLRAEACWLLANVYLKDGKAAEAASALAEVIQLGRRHKDQAQKKLEALRKIQSW
jgi:tetratricopeptide (TPR) repeat protein